MRFVLAVLLAALCVANHQLELRTLTGINFVQRNSPTSQKYPIETMVGGVALLDYNNDGLLDLFFVNGGRLADPIKLPPDFGRKDPSYWNRLYRQNKDGTFTDVTSRSGLIDTGNNYGMGVATGDYNNDGFVDLYVTNYGSNTLHRNNGNGTFTNVTAKAGVAGGGWSASAGFFDYDNDGRLDLFVTRYLDYDIANNISCGKPFRAYCGPNKFGTVTNFLFHNEGDGTFRDVSKSSGVSSMKGKALGVGFNDYNGDGFTDVFVANDGMEQFLLHNNGDGTFRECAVQAGVAFSGDGKTYAGMGVAFTDYDNDRLPDLAVTNLALEKYALYRNDGKGLFTYTTLTSGLAALSARNSGWGVGLVDFDNDGWKDLFMAQSHVLDNVEKIFPGLHYLEPPSLLKNSGGRFERWDLGEIPAIAGRGVAFGDINNDGAIDAVVSILNERPMIFFNRKSSENHWLTIKLVGTRSNRDGFGAKITIGDQLAYATSAGSYLSASDSRAHFGLGSQTSARVEIVWPNGRKQVIDNVAVDRILTVKEVE